MRCGISGHSVGELLIPCVIRSSTIRYCYLGVSTSEQKWLCCEVGEDVRHNRTRYENATPESRPTEYLTFEQFEAVDIPSASPLLQGSCRAAPVAA